MTVSDGVSPSPKGEGGGGAGSAPSLDPPLMKVLFKDRYQLFFLFALALSNALSL